MITSGRENDIKNNSQELLAQPIMLTHLSPDANEASSTTSSTQIFSFSSRTDLNNISNSNRDQFMNSSFPLSTSSSTYSLNEAMQPANFYCAPDSNVESYRFPISSTGLCKLFANAKKISNLF